MPPPINTSYDQLGTRFWLTQDTEALQSAYNELKDPASLDIDKQTRVDEIKTSDRRIHSLVRSGTTDKFENVFGRAKAFAVKLDMAKLAYNTDLAGALGSLDGLTKSIGLLNLRHEGQKTLFTDVPKYSRDQVETMLKVMLATEDFRNISPSHLSGGELESVRLSLLNATLGALKLVREEKATPDSIFELAKGNLYDLSKATDVCKLSVLTATRAREKFVDESGLTALVESYKANHGGVESDQVVRMRGLVAAIVAERKDLSKILDLKYQGGEGSTASVEKQMNEVRRHMRAFRYDLDRLTGKSMEWRESIRRAFDNLKGVKENRHTSQMDYAREVDLVNELNDLLGEGGIARSCIDPKSEATKAATNLTHTANNQIRYYKSGKERSYDTFSERAHKFFDEMNGAGSRTIKFTAGASIAGKLGIAKVEGRADYVHTATVSLSGGEYVITHVDGVELSGQASIGAGYEDGQDPAETNLSEGDIAVGAGIGAKASLGGGYQRTVSYKNVSDLIADLKGGSEIIDASYNKVRFCLGRIGMGLKKLGQFFKFVATDVLGFREHHSRMDQKLYQAMLVNEGILGDLDQLLVQNTRALKTSQTTAFKIDASAGAFAGVNVGRYDGANEDGETTSTSLFEAQASVTGSVSRETFVTSRNFRPLSERLANHSLQWLREELDDPTFTLPRSMSQAKTRLKEMEARMRRLEAQTEALRGSEDRQLTEDQLDDFAAAWKKLALEAELLKRTWIGILDRDGAPIDDPQRDEVERAYREVANHLDRPRVTMSDDDFESRFMESMFTSSNGTVTKSLEIKLEIGALNDLDSLIDEKTGVGDLEDGLGKDLLSGATNAPVSGLTDTILPLSQSVSFKVTTSHKVHQDDVRPWVNSKSTDISFSLSTNLPARALARKIADAYFKGNDEELDENRPDLKEDFINDLEFNLKQAGADALESAGNSMLARIFGFDGEKNGSSVEIDNTVSLTLHFENGRLCSVAETESMGATGTLKVGFTVGALEIGVKVSDSVTDVTSGRFTLVNAPVEALLADAEKRVRSGAGLVSLKGSIAGQHQSYFRMMEAFQCKGKNTAIPEHWQHSAKFAQDVKAAQEMLDKAKALLKQATGIPNGQLLELPADRQDRARELERKLAADLAAIEDLDFTSADDRQNQVDVTAAFMADLAAVFVFARENNLH